MHGCREDWCHVSGLEKLTEAGKFVETLHNVEEFELHLLENKTYLQGCSVVFCF